MPLRRIGIVLGCDWDPDGDCETMPRGVEGPSRWETVPRGVDSFDPHPLGVEAWARSETCHRQALNCAYEIRQYYEPHRQRAISSHRPLPNCETLPIVCVRTIADGSGLRLTFRDLGAPVDGAPDACAGRDSPCRSARSTSPPAVALWVNFSSPVTYKTKDGASDDNFSERNECEDAIWSPAKGSRGAAWLITWVFLKVNQLNNQTPSNRWDRAASEGGIRSNVNWIGDSP